MNQAAVPETVLQFGAGNFLRAFADLFIHQANEEGQDVGRIVIVQSTDSGRAAAMNRSGSNYHVLIRGMWQGHVVDDAILVRSVSRALSARTQWSEVLEVGTSRELKLVLSNTTEAGMALDEADRQSLIPPASFPAKLTRILAARFAGRLPGLTIMPCELVEKNGEKLLQLCVEQASRWGLPTASIAYIQKENVWLNSLVDRIVSGKPAGHALLDTDPLLTAAEPYALWAVEADDPSLVPFTHEALKVIPDVQSYALRKIRVLNGAHSALVCKALPLGFQTVREAMENAEVGGWLRGLLFDEIVPVLEGRVDQPGQFAKQTLERFANPFLNHKLADIALNHEAKLKTRLLPTLADYRAKFGRDPARLAAILESRGE